MTALNHELCVHLEELSAIGHGFSWIPWSDFLLNPRRLRGSDFLMRWSQGWWSEDRLVTAVNDTGSFFALPYGPSGAAPDDDPKSYELYFERLEAAGLGATKRPDLLVFRAHDRQTVGSLVNELGGVGELPFQAETDKRMQALIRLAVVAIECENSLWVCSDMPDFGVPLSPQRRLAGRPGLRKNAVAPTIIVKEEDRASLRRWEEAQGTPIHIWHAFYDRSFGIARERVEDLIRTGLVEPTRQVFQAPSGATSAKTIFKVYYHYGYPVAKARELPEMEAKYIKDRNGHVLPYVTFVGGSVELEPEAMDVLAELAARSAESAADASDGTAHSGEGDRLESA